MNIKNTLRFALSVAATGLVLAPQWAIAYEPPLCGTGTPGYYANNPDADAWREREGLWVCEHHDGSATNCVQISKEEVISRLLDPVAGNKCITMFRAMAAADINGKCNPTSCIRPTLQDAETWFLQNCWVDEYEPFDIVSAGGRHSPWRTGDPIYQYLDAYNNGLLCAVSRDALEGDK